MTKREYIRRTSRNSFEYAERMKKLEIEESIAKASTIVPYDECRQPGDNPLSNMFVLTIKNV